MSTMASRITSLTIVYSTAYSGAVQRNHQSSASLAFVSGIHRWSVNSSHKGSVTQKMFPFDDVIMSMYDSIALVVHEEFHLPTLSRYREIISTCSKIFPWSAELKSCWKNIFRIIYRKICPTHWPFVRGIHQSPVNFPHKGRWRGALIFSLICTWTVE